MTFDVNLKFIGHSTRVRYTFRWAFDDKNGTIEMKCYFILFISAKLM